MIYALATISALMFALASALQHKSAQKADHKKAMRPSLLFVLALDPIWLLGIFADIVALFFQFDALINGSVLVVQPILAIGLVFSLLFSALLNDKRLTSKELALAILTTLALFGFLSVGVPPRLVDRSSLVVWVFVVLATGVVVTILVIIGMRSTLKGRTVALAIAAGVLHGVAVSLSKMVSQSYSSNGLVYLLVDPHTWLLVVVGAADLLVIQSAFQAGPLRISLPIISVIEPVIALSISISVLHERLTASGFGIVLAVVSLVAMLFGVSGLARITTTPDQKVEE